MNNLHNIVATHIRILTKFYNTEITPTEKRALERAISWLKNVTEPLSEADHVLWYENCAMNEEAAFIDDHKFGEYADAIAASATDEDKRNELKEYQEEIDTCSPYSD